MANTRLSVPVVVRALRRPAKAAADAGRRRSTAQPVRRRTADLFVMVTVSRSRLSRPVIGNTAEAVIDHVDCDILAVKPARFKSPVRPMRAKS